MIIFPLLKLEISSHIPNIDQWILYHMMPERIQIGEKGVILEILPPKENSEIFVPNKKGLK